MDDKVFASLMSGPCEQRKLGGKYQLLQRSGGEEGSGKEGSTVQREGGAEGGIEGQGKGWGREEP